jgi:hypothetical protein
MGNQCGATPSDPYHANLCLLSYIINRVKSTGKLLPNADEPEPIPEGAELDKWETFVGSKKARSSYRHFMTDEDHIISKTYESRK